MIKAITVTNHLGFSHRMILSQFEEGGLLVSNVDGLGPVKANVNMTNVASMDGAIFNSARMQTRNIVLTLIFQPCPTIEDARHLTYKLFPVKKRVKIEVETDRHTVYTYGYVESNEPAIFSSSESAQISILCPTSYFVDSTEETVMFSSVNPNFEFPFWKNTNEADTLVLSEVNQEHSKTIVYEGTYNIGPLVTMHFLGSVGNLKLIHSENDAVMSIDVSKIQTITGTAISDADEIEISMEKGNKYAVLTRQGVRYNIINALSINSDWFTLDQGENTIIYEAESNPENVYVTVTYRTAYEGV